MTKGLAEKGWGGSVLLCGWLAATGACAQADTVVLAKALADGHSAYLTHDAGGLLNAAHTLDQLGAHPGPATPDLARTWHDEAIALGAVDTVQPWRGRTLGPAYSMGTVDMRQTYTTRQTFYAGQRAEIALLLLDGEGLSLSVETESGEKACNLILEKASGVCSWVPVWTVPYTIRLNNPTPSLVRFLSCYKLSGLMCPLGVSP